MPDTAAVPRLVDHFEAGLDAPICLTWELTYACNLACIHCLSSSGRRDPRELTTAECFGVIDELQAMQVFYVNIGGGEPTVRRDFWEILDYATAHDVGVKFSTNGSRITEQAAARVAANDYLDVQISLDGASAAVNDAIRGPGSFDTAIRALERLAEAGAPSFKISVVITRENMDQLDDFEALADHFGAQLRLTRLRPSGRGADVWDRLHPTSSQQRQLYDWLVERGDKVLTGDSFFHLAAYGEPLARSEHVWRGPGGLPDRSGRRRVCLPVRDPRRVPRREHPGARRLSVDLARLRAVHGSQAAADRWRMRVVLALRFVSRRLHGGEVLHRAAAHGPRSRVRPRKRRVVAVALARAGCSPPRGRPFAPTSRLAL